MTLSQVLWFAALAAGAAALLVARSVSPGPRGRLVAAAAVAALALLPSAGATAFEPPGDPPANLAQR